MKNGGTMFTMTYYGSQTVIEHYNVMGVAKAALEAAVRYIAAEVGPRGIGVHAISPGPLATRAASGIPEFDELLERAQSKAPARHLVSGGLRRFGDSLFQNQYSTASSLLLPSARPSSRAFSATGGDDRSDASAKSLAPLATGSRLKDKPLSPRT